MKKIKKWFIGDYLTQTEDVFERAKIELLYGYSMAFFLLGTLFYIHIIYLQLWLHVAITTVAVVSLAGIPFILKYKHNVKLAAICYVTQQIIVSVGNIILEQGKSDAATGFWVSLFILFAFFLFDRKWGMIIMVIMGTCSAFAGAVSETIVTSESGALSKLPDSTILPFILIIIVIAMFIKTRQDAEEFIHEQKSELEIKNKEITDSINYAQRIQKAILPSNHLVEEYLPNSFIAFLPKDIVSGDFYWVEKKGNKIFFAVADCTGHGVPGAMMSVIGQNALNRVVNEYGITNPGLILDKLNDLVQEGFAKSGSDVKDGMDISLCVYDTSIGTLEFAAAHNPLYVISNGQLNEIKGTKQPIGKFETKIAFQNNEVKIQKGDVIYLFSDGIADQFGGPDGKKFKYKRVKEILIANHNKSNSEQKNAVISAFSAWRGNLEQVDDVCMMGIKF
jgi:serine phosphatase RsbU (regulator of sigma subunit)